MKDSLIRHLHNPFSEKSDSKELLNIANNTLISREHEVCDRDQIGLALQQEFVLTRLLPVPGPLQGVSLWSPMKKRNLKTFVNVRKPIKHRFKQQSLELKEERSLLTRFLLIQQGRPDLIKLNDAIGKYEFSAIPRSLFDSNGIIRLPSDKSEFMTEIEAFKNTSAELPNQRGSFANVDFTVTIIDAMVKVQSLSKGVIKTDKDYGDAFVSLIDCYQRFG